MYVCMRPEILHRVEYIDHTSRAVSDIQYTACGAEIASNFEISFSRLTERELLRVRAWNKTVARARARAIADRYEISGERVSARESFFDGRGEREGRRS